MKQALIAGAFALVSLFTVGCAGNRYGYGGGYYASGPPPPPRVEYYGAPRPGRVWINGNWGWNGGRYNWNNGYWARPPRRGAAWVPGQWNNTPRGWNYRRGYWR